MKEVVDIGKRRRNKKKKNPSIKKINGLALVVGMTILALLGVMVLSTLEASQLKKMDQDYDMQVSSWKASIPQKISQKAYDEKGSPLNEGNLIFEQTLRIGNLQKIEPKKIALYEFIKATNMDGTERELNYNITANYQEGRLIYRRRGMIINARQIILEPASKVEIPKEGTIRIDSKEYASSNLTKKINSGADNQTVSFTPIELLLNDEKETFTVTPLNLGFYDIEGYVLTPNNDPHKESEMKESVTIDSSKGTEFWLTVYVKPKTGNSIYLSMVNNQLNIYYSNVTAFTVYIDGEVYKKYDVENSPVEESKILPIPLNQTRNKITVIYKDHEDNPKEAIWNNKGEWEDVKPPSSD